MFAVTSQDSSTVRNEVGLFYSRHIPVPRDSLKLDDITVCYVFGIACNEQVSAEKQGRSVNSGTDTDRHADKQTSERRLQVAHGTFDCLKSSASVLSSEIQWVSYDLGEVNMPKNSVSGNSSAAIFN